MHLRYRRRNAGSSPAFFGAGEEARTPDLLLGKQMLYQLSYTRVCVYLEKVALRRSTFKPE